MDVYKFNTVYNKRVLYYINADNVLCNEKEFEKLSVQNIISELKKEFDTNPYGVKEVIEKYKRFGYIGHDKDIGDVLKMIESSLDDMYLKKNRVFKSPNEMCDVLTRIIGKPTLF